ncbi:hypothetical protein ACH4SK_40610 [Streptomyces inhibens]|uniref:hypothetical protein n=1 Tax=Streptomyces inhibens TaxID=2293571 RepID=UPI0037A3DC89
MHKKERDAWENGKPAFADHVRERLERTSLLVELAAHPCRPALLVRVRVHGAGSGQHRAAAGVVNLAWVVRPPGGSRPRRGHRRAAR